jgi:hypothetical protein
LISGYVLFTGAVAAVEYVAFAWYAINQTTTENIEPILVGFPQHLFKGCLLLGTGLVAGMVTIQIKRRIIRSIERRSRSEIESVEHSVSMSHLP